jgi:hypothetical protein
MALSTVWTTPVDEITRQERVLEPLLTLYGLKDEMTTRGMNWQLIRSEGLRFDQDQ